MELERHRILDICICSSCAERGGWRGGSVFLLSLAVPADRKENATMLWPALYCSIAFLPTLLYWICATFESNCSAFYSKNNQGSVILIHSKVREPSAQ